MLRRDLAKVRTAVGLDDKAFAEPGMMAEQKEHLAALHVDQYLETLAGNKTQFVAVPPFLAARLRAQRKWEVTSAGIERVLERSTELRAMVDSLRPATPPGASPTDSGGKNAAKK